MSSMRILIAGCGYVGTAAGRSLARAGHEVFGIRRRLDALPKEIRGVSCDLLAERRFEMLPRGLDAVVWAVSPEPGDEGYAAAYVEAPRRLLAALDERGDPVRRAVLVASTSVWHFEDGRVVEDDAPPAPAGFRGQRVLDGEAVFEASPFESTSLRLGGIYGPGRARLLARARSGELAPPLEAVYSNRIHRDDAARAIVLALHAPSVESHYTVVDDEPSDLREVYAWIADYVGVPLAAPAPFRGRGSKRCRNSRLRELGWCPIYPDYRVGFDAIASSEG